MTIQEAQSAARRNLPVVYDSPMDGPMLYARIGCIRKDYARKEDAERGVPAEVYGLELLPMNGARSVTVVPPELVRQATAREVADYNQYRYDTRAPEVHPELFCEEIRKTLPHGMRKE